MSEPYTLTEKEEEQLFSFFYTILPTLNKKTMSKHIGEVFKLHDKLKKRYIKKRKIQEYTQEEYNTHLERIGM